MQPCQWLEEAVGASVQRAVATLEHVWQWRNYADQAYCSPVRSAMLANAMLTNSLSEFANTLLLESVGEFAFALLTK
jgi:hypothetical protein